MIRISDTAQSHFAKLLAGQEEGTQIRVFVINPGTPNAECGVSYCQYNKKRLREIDRRVRYLTKCLEQLKIVDYSPQQEGKVFFGAWVEIENDAGNQMRFRIVGYDEIFGRRDYISIDSPMARALLKKEVGDLAIVQTPAGEAQWYVNEIEYVK